MKNYSIDNIAALAKLNFNSEEKEEILKDMEEMILFADALKEFDESGEVQTEMEYYNRLRDDNIEPSCTREQMLTNAPSHTGKYISVPKTL